MAHFRGEALDRGGDHAERGEIHGVTVAGDNLGRDRLDLEAHLLGHVFFDARIDIGEGADRAGDGAGGNLPLGLDEAQLAALEFRIGLSELETEGRGLRMNAVGAADGRRHLVLESPALDGGEQFVHVAQQQVGRAGELHVEGGVEHV